MSETRAPLKLEESLLLEGLEGQRAAMVAELEQGLPLRLDGSAVREVDGAGLQLLLAAAQAARRRGGTIEWQASSSSLKDAAALLGVIQPLNLEGTTT